MLSVIVFRIQKQESISLVMIKTTSLLVIQSRLGFGTIARWYSDGSNTGENVAKQLTDNRDRYIKVMTFIIVQ